MLHGINLVLSTALYFFFLQGIILVYDITRQETFNNIRKWLRYVDEVSVQAAGSIFLIFLMLLVTNSWKVFSWHILQNY